MKRRDPNGTDGDGSETAVDAAMVTREGATRRQALYHRPPPDLGERLGRPGEPPYTRGIHPGMYRERLWTMRQYAGFGSVQETNRRYRWLLEGGGTGLSVAFDLPTQLGLDPDDPRASGEVGRVGVSVATVDDAVALFDGIPLDQVTTSMTINAPAALLVALYQLAGEAGSVPPDRLRGTVQNDVLKEYAARGTDIWPLRPSMRLTTDLLRFVSDTMPGFHPISVSGYHLREAGATAAQELAFTLANAEAYLQAAADSGLDLERVAARLSFFFACHQDFFEEVAKFRVARRLWSRRAKERFGLSNPRALSLRFHTQTGGSTLTAQQPDTNVVRTTLQALAAVLGGTQSLHTNAFDEAIGLPTEASAKLALRTQQVIAYESGVAEAIDPLAGSYYLEHLCDALEADAEALLQAIDERGGAVEALAQGYVHDAIEAAAYQHQRAVEDGSIVVVGLNRFAEEGITAPAQSLRIDPELERTRATELRRFREERDGAAASAALRRLRDAADAADAPLSEPIRDALAARATLGETCDALRAAWGESRTPGGVR